MNAAQSSPSPLSEPVRTALRLLLVGVLLLAWLKEAEPVDAPTGLQ